MFLLNKAKCIGCGACASTCGECFGMKDGKAYVKKQCNKPCVKEAKENCPVDAIK